MFCRIPLRKPLRKLLRTSLIRLAAPGRKRLSRVREGIRRGVRKCAPKSPYRGIRQEACNKEAHQHIFIGTVYFIYIYIYI